LEDEKMSIYEDRDYIDRNEYLESLSDEYGVDIDTVFILADILGESEDFDGLISSLEDASAYFGGSHD
jgi:hypothetical protein